MNDILDGAGVTRRELLVGAARLAPLLAAPSLLGGCAAGGAGGAVGGGGAAGGAVGAGSATIITWVGGIASLIGAVPVARDVAKWVRGRDDDQVVARAVRKEFRSERNGFTFEDGAMVHRWRDTYFFAAATPDGTGGCCAFIARGQLLQIIESRAAAAMHGVVERVEGVSDRALARTFVPVRRAPRQSLVGRLEDVDDVFRYKTAYGTARFKMTKRDQVKVRASTSGSREISTYVTVRASLEA